jgi:hypothetical protein
MGEVRYARRNRSAIPSLRLGSLRSPRRRWPQMPSVEAPPPSFPTAPRVTTSEPRFWIKTRSPVRWAPRSAQRRWHVHPVKLTAGPHQSGYRVRQAHGPGGGVCAGVGIRPRMLVQAQAQFCASFSLFFFSFLFFRILFGIYNFTQDSNLGFEFKCTYKNSAWNAIIFLY